MNLVKEGLKAMGEEGKSSPEDNSLKLFSASYDATFITLYAKDIEDAKRILISDDPTMFLIGKDKLFIVWNDDHKEEVIIERIPTKRGIVTFESH